MNANIVCVAWQGSVACQFGLDVESILTTLHAYFNANVFKYDSFTNCACKIYSLPRTHQN